MQSLTKRKRNDYCRLLDNWALQLSFIPVIGYVLFAADTAVALRADDSAQPYLDGFMVACMAALAGHWALSFFTVDACGLLLLIENAILVSHGQIHVQMPVTPVLLPERISESAACR